ncbi:MAG: GTP cyclohydrolase MptA [Synergistaceae bacterium]|jgi:GTP cyclohydrolase-4|nr:GTP cyclohydrolase MptA [Synergistaceae bacterium]
MENDLGNDIQKSAPATKISLSRVGVTGLKRILRLKGESGRETLFFAEMNLYAHLDATQSGVHMSRFIENIENAASEIAMSSSPDFETLTDRMAISIAKTQGATRAGADVRAQCPMTRRTPASNMKVENLYTFIGYSASDGASTRRATGVEVNGLTVCPCAREMVSEHARSALKDAGYSDEQVTEILSILPIASHNQRGLGTLLVGSETPIRMERLVSIVEDSMSSGIYELLKRPDELRVVWDGHMKPRFVEDVVREMLRGVIERLPELEDDAFVIARQENFESIHVHNAYAERSGLLGDIKNELRGIGRPCAPATLESWLDASLQRYV